MTRRRTQAPFAARYVVHGLFRATAQLDASCARARAAARAPDARGVADCWDASHVLPHVGAPLLLAQNFWDELQLDDILCFEGDRPRRACPDAYLRAFKNATVGQLAGLAARGGRAGLWMPSCFAHTSDTCTAAATAVRGARYGEALAAWLAPGGLEAPPVLLDDCVPADGADPDVVPCNPVCSGCGGE